MSLPHPTRLFFVWKRSLLALCLTSVATYAGSNVDTLIVTERFDGQRPADSASSIGANNYQIFDGGFIDAGDSVAGEKPPQAADVVAALSGALESTASKPGAQPFSPLAIIVHWGVIRADRSQPTPVNRLNPNLRGRIALVGTARIAGTLENYLLRNSPKKYRNSNFPTPLFVSGGELKIAGDQTDLPRYFLAISAYDAAALREQKATLVWRTTLSAAATEAAMDRSIFTFATTAAAYVGRDYNEVITLKAPLASQPAAGLVAKTGTAEDDFLRALIHAERTKFSGELLEGNEEKLVAAFKASDRG